MRKGTQIIGACSDFSCQNCLVTTATSPFVTSGKKKKEKKEKKLKRKNNQNQEANLSLKNNTS